MGYEKIFKICSFIFTIWYYRRFENSVAPQFNKDYKGYVKMLMKKYTFWSLYPFHKYGDSYCNNIGILQLFITGRNMNLVNRIPPPFWNKNKLKKITYFVHKWLLTINCLIFKIKIFSVLTHKDRWFKNMLLKFAGFTSWFIWLLMFLVPPST